MTLKKFINTSAFPMVDGTNGQRFEPGEVTRAEVTDWVKSQDVIKPVGDPDAVPQGDASAPAQGPGPGGVPAANPVATGAVPPAAPAAPVADKK